MTSLVKHNTSQPYYRKAHSFSEISTPNKMGQMHSGFFNGQFYFPSVGSVSQRNTTVLPGFKSTKCNIKMGLFGSEGGQYQVDNVLLHSLSNSIDRIQGNIMPVIKDTNLLLPAFAAPIIKMDKITASQPVNCLVSENNSNLAGVQDNNTCNSNCPVLKEVMQGNSTCNSDCAVLKEAVQDTNAYNNSDCAVLKEAMEDSNACNNLDCAVLKEAMQGNNTCNSDCAVLKEAMQGNNTETRVVSSSVGESNVTCCSNIAVESNQSTGMSSYCECLPDLSADKCFLHDSNYSSSNIQNCKKVMNTKLTTDDSTCKSALKPILNLISVLSAPRKTTKKGRPSSKKQKKRQREKRKLEAQTLQTKDILGSAHTGCDIEERLHLQNKELLCDQIKTSDISPIPSCNAKFEAAHEIVNQTRPLTHLFVTMMSYSEDENSVEDDDDEPVRDDFCVKKHKEKELPLTSVKSVKGLGFHCALDLDAIFKKTVPQTMFSTDKKADAFKNNNGFHKNVCQSSSPRNSFDKHSTTSALPVPKDGDSCFFTPALSLDILFCKKPTSSTQPVVDLKEDTFDSLDDVPSDDSLNHMSSSTKADDETLEKINTLWNENYPTSGFRSCSSDSTDEIKHPTVKVHFAANPHFLTVHIVGTEERNGNWHHVIREREHFERRISELEHILSPFLESSHRIKVLAHRSGQELQ